jgi:hypothetical protein
METERSHLNPGFKVVSQASACAEDVPIPETRRVDYRGALPVTAQGRSQ